MELCMDKWKHECRQAEAITLFFLLMLSFRNMPSLGHCTSGEMLIDLSRKRPEKSKEENQGPLEEV